MAESSYEVIVIGSGPGGYVAAIRAAQLGKKTAVVERDKVGGRCLNYACIPAKSVLRSADLPTEVREGGEYGGQVGSNGVDYEATQARRATLATGSVPLGVAGVELGGRVIGTEEAWALQELPARLAVVGCGASGAEIASGFVRLGSEVILLEAAEAALPAEDKDISRLVERGLKRQGIDIRTKTPIGDVQASENGVSFSFAEERAEVDYIVIAAGRAADVEGLGLAEAGVELEGRLVKVDGAQRTSRAGVYAIGDLVHGPALAHKASDEGVIAAEDIAGRPTHPIAYADIPRATFCTPNVGSFGLTEAEAREEGHDVVVGKVPYGAVGGGTVYGDRTGLVKVVGESRYGELLGGHRVGARATELIQELVNVRALEGGFPEVARIVHGHPTLSEAVMEAGRAADGWLIHG